MISLYQGQCNSTKHKESKINHRVKSSSWCYNVWVLYRKIILLNAQRLAFDRKKTSRLKKRSEVYCFILVLKFPKLHCCIVKHDVCASNLHQTDSWRLHISRGLQNPRFSANSTPHKHSSVLISIGVAHSMLVTAWARNWKKDSASCSTH